MSFDALLSHLDGFTQRATELAFPLGGIGTGNVSIGARGELRDWELFNQPGVGNKFPYTFFALHVAQGDARSTRVLEAALQPPFSKSHGIDSMDVGGLPRMRESRFRAEYPLMRVDLIDDSLPVEVALEAYTPFIPLNEDDSALPVAILRYRVRNRSQAPVFAAVAGSMANMTTFNGYEAFNYVRYAGPTRNTGVEESGLSGVLMESEGFPADHPMRCSMALFTTNGQSTMKPEWYDGAWYDPIQDFWDDFSTDGRLEPNALASAEEHTLMKLRGQKIGSVAPYANLAPGEEAVFEFFVCWHLPNRVLGWKQDREPERQAGACCVDCPACAPKTTRNHYSLRFGDALDVGRYVARELPRLERDTLLFHKALFDSTLPEPVLDALSANITVLRSTTCFRIEDGTFFGWEGCFEKGGCCDGTCTHVWNYAQTMAFLFPRLEQSMRRDDFLKEVEADGKMNFRSRRTLGEPEFDMYPAVDGQCGSIVRLYREWKLSGDDKLILDVGDAALRALDFAASYWDADGDGLVDSRQHNTYDIEFYGPNSMANSLYFAALKAGAAIARALGQAERGNSYERLAEDAAKRMDALLWGGEYYIQKLDDIDEHRYQFGTGCLSDQLFGQLMAHVAGLGYVLPADHVRQAMESIFRYNFRKDFSTFANVQRTYCLEHEQGLLLCSWPHGGRPRFPFVYCDEVWTGIEYQVAAGLIYEGLVDEGLTIVGAVRERHDGIRRNPFSEVECGNHYARSMASWALLLALSGFRYDMTRNEIGFEPRIHQDDFQCFFSTGKSWGIFKQRKQPDGTLKRETQVLYSASDERN